MTEFHRPSSATNPISKTAYVFCFLVSPGLVFALRRYGLFGRGTYSLEQVAVRMQEGSYQYIRED